MSSSDVVIHTEWVPRKHSVHLWPDPRHIVLTHAPRPPFYYPLTVQFLSLLFCSPLPNRLFFFHSPTTSPTLVCLFFHWTFSLRTLSPFGCVCFLWLPVFCQPLPLSLLTKQTQFNFTPSCPLSVTFKSRYLPKCSCLGHQRYAKIYKQIPISACIFA